MTFFYLYHASHIEVRKKTRVRFRSLHAIAGQHMRYPTYLQVGEQDFGVSMQYIVSEDF
jgi:hypothetical protein